MKTSQMQSLVDAVRFSAKGESLEEAKNRGFESST